MSEQQLAGKTAFVTGGTAGIGLAVARAYTNAGAEVVIGGRRDDGEEIARDAGCRFVALDVGNELDVKRALAAAEQQVEDLVGVYVFFASDASRYVTGQALNVDGGLTAGITPGVLRAVAAKVWKDAERAAATVGAES